MAFRVYCLANHNDDVLFSPATKATNAVPGERLVILLPRSTIGCVTGISDDVAFPAGGQREPLVVDEIQMRVSCGSAPLQSDDELQSDHLPL